MLKIAIISVNYNRLPSLKRQLTSLENAFYPEKVTLIISIDKSNTDEVERFADEYVWKFGEKRVVKHKENLGLRNHMLSLGKYFDEFDALIVLEDDITVAQSFYLYAKACVEKYHDNDDIAGISLYSHTHTFTYMPFSPMINQYDVYFRQEASSWGEVWMKKQWIVFYDWYRNNNGAIGFSSEFPITISMWGDKSWLKYHIKYCIVRNKYFVYPYVSLSTNHGDIGVHTSSSEYYNCNQVSTLYGLKYVYNLPDIHNGIKYDAFFSNERLYEVIGISKEDLTIDLFCARNVKSINTKFILTTRYLNYRIIDSYSLELKPIEMNVINKVNGKGIFLYDKDVPEHNNNHEEIALINYYFPYWFLVTRKCISFRSFMRYISRKMISKVKCRL